MGDETATPDDDVVSTGVPGLDAVLGGGLPRGALHLIQGQAGTGKTVLASQLAFHRAACGDRVLYLTVLAEPHGRLLAHLRKFSFFDERQIPSAIVMLSGYQALTDNGLDGMLAQVLSLMQEYSPALLVVDGFRAATLFSDSDRVLSRFLHQLDGVMSGARCTGVLLSPLHGIEPRPEHTLVDGLFETSVESRGLRRVRAFEVHKLRGANQMEGRHLFRISVDGVRIFPRFEARAAEGPMPPPHLPGRVACGYPDLDAMMDGGVRPGSTTAILGTPGAGKTLLGLSFLHEGLQRGEPGLYFGFYESPARLLAKAAGVGLHLETAVDRGRLAVVWQAPLELLLDELGQRLLTQVADTKATRVFVDGLDGFHDSAAYPERFHSFIAALTVHLRAAGVTTFFTHELPLLDSDPSVARGMRMSALMENILLLRTATVDSTLRRLISVVKMRENAHDGDVREFTIAADGLHLGPRFSPATTHKARRIGGGSSPQGA